MAINVDLSKTDRPESVGEYVRVAPGAAHLMAIEVKENGGKNGEHVVKIEVLNHADAGEIGKTHTELFPATPEMAWKVLSFSYATKIADREAMAKAKAAGTEYAPIDLQSAEGRQFFGTFKSTDKDGKTFINLTDMLSIDDPKAKNHPRNVGMLNQAVGGMASGAGAGASAGAGTGAKTAAPVGAGAGAANAAANPFASLT